jgi:ABC-type nitrate/sulfonate/bicarbonate transport system substrate-binding protein
MKKVLNLSIVLVLLVALFTVSGLPAADAAKSKNAALKKVVFVVPRSMECMDDMALWAADYMGYFKEEGIAFEMQQAFGTTDIKMIATKNAQFGWPSPNLTLASIEQGLPVISVAQADAVNIFGMAVKTDSGIKTWADLKGKTIALGDAAWATIAAPTVTAAGLDPKKDIKYIVAGDSRYQMVSEGKIDALFTWISEYNQLKGQGFKFNYLDGNKVLPVCANSVITNTAYLKSDPKMVSGFVRAWAKGIYFVKCNPEAATDIVLNKFPAIQISWDGAVGCAYGRIEQAFGTTPEDTESILNAGIGHHFTDKWQNVIDWAQKTGAIKNKVAISKAFTNKYIDTKWDKAKVEADAKNYKCSSKVYMEAHKK